MAVNNKVTVRRFRVQANLSIEHFTCGIRNTRRQITAQMLNIVGTRRAVTRVRRHRFPQSVPGNLHAAIPKGWYTVDEFALCYFDEDGKFPRLKKIHICWTEINDLLPSYCQM